jgi:hypothetical protein
MKKSIARQFEAEFENVLYDLYGKHLYNLAKFEPTIIETIQAKGSPPVVDESPADVVQPELANTPSPLDREHTSIIEQSDVFAKWQEKYGKTDVEELNNPEDRNDRIDD